MTLCGCIIIYVDGVILQYLTYTLIITEWAGIMRLYFIPALKVTYSHISADAHASHITCVALAIILLRSGLRTLSHIKLM